MKKYNMLRYIFLVCCLNFSYLLYASDAYLNRPINQCCDEPSIKKSLLTKNAWKLAFIGHYADALYCLREAAKQGDLLAIKYLARGYEEGSIITGIDRVQAEEFKQEVMRCSARGKPLHDMASGSIDLKVQHMEERLRGAAFARAHQWYRDLQPILQRTGVWGEKKLFRFPIPERGLEALIFSYLGGKISELEKSVLSAGVNKFNSPQLYRWILGLLDSRGETLQIEPNKKEVLLMMVHDWAMIHEPQKLEEVLYFQGINDAWLLFNDRDAAASQKKQALNNLLTMIPGYYHVCPECAIQWLGYFINNNETIKKVVKEKSFKAAVMRTGETRFFEQISPALIEEYKVMSLMQEEGESRAYIAPPAIDVAPRYYSAIDYKGESLNPPLTLVCKTLEGTELHDDLLFGFVNQKEEAHGGDVYYRLHACHSDDGTMVWASPFQLKNMHPFVVKKDVVCCINDVDDIIVLNKKDGSIVESCHIAQQKKIKSIHIPEDNWLFAVYEMCLYVINREEKSYISCQMQPFVNTNKYHLVGDTLIVYASNQDESQGRILIFNKEGCRECVVKSYHHPDLEGVIQGNQYILWYAAEKKKSLIFFNRSTKLCIDEYDLKGILQDEPQLSKKGDILFLLTDKALIALDIHEMPDKKPTLVWTVPIDESGFAAINRIIVSDDGAKVYGLDDSSGNLYQFDCLTGFKQYLYNIKRDTCCRMLGMYKGKLYIQ
jgi:hypothetical protein